MVEKYSSFNTQKRKRAENDFEKDFCELLVNPAFGEFLENVCSRLEKKFLKHVFKKIIKQQSILVFLCIHKSYENCDSYTFKRTKWFWIKIYMLVLVY